jgi:hypothetical protein
MYRNPIRRQSKTEARIAQGRTIVRANTAAMSFDNRLTDCQTHFHAGVFQNVDEPAYHEFICKRAGISVHYCAEQFENDETPYSALFKVLKRIMAAEYSRELSRKVFEGQLRTFENGFKLGGVAGYGLRRMLVDERLCKKNRTGPWPEEEHQY